MKYQSSRFSPFSPTRRFSFLSKSFLALSLSLATLEMGFSAVGTYDGGTSANSTAWATTTNWSPDGAIGVNGTNGSAGATNTDTAVFDVLTGTATLATIGINLNTSYASHQINLGAIVNSGTSNRSIGDSTTVSGTMRLNGATVDSVNNVILSNSGTALLSIQPSAGSTGLMSVTLGNLSSVVLLQNTGTISVSSNIGEINAGSSITVSGSGNGTFILSGSNSYTGGTIINNGNVVVGNNAALGTGAVTVNSSLNLATFSPVVGALSGTGSVTSSPAGSSTFTVGNGGGSASFGGVISNSSGALSLIKAGSGTQTLTNDNTYSGSTVVSAGKLALSGSGAIGSGALSIGNGAVLDVSAISGSTYAISSPLTTTGSGNIVATGKSVSVNGATSVGGDSVVGSLNITGNLTLSGTANFTITGVTSGLYDTISVSGGLTYSSLTIALDTASFSPSSLTNTNLQLFTAGSFAGTSLTFTGTALSGGYSWDFSNLATSGYITLVAPVGGSSLTWGAGGAGGTGTWNTSNTNWYNGTSSVAWDSSKLAVFAGTAGTVTVSGTVGANSGLEFDTAGYTLQSGTIVLGGASTLANSITGTTGTTIINSVLTGSNGLTKAGAGTLVLGGANTYTGTTVISAGTLALGANDVLADATDLLINSGVFDIKTFSDTIGNITLVSGTIAGTSGVLTASSYSVQSGLISANLAGGGGLTKTTSGTVTLTGSNSYTGTTTLSAGELAVGSDQALGASTLALNGGTFSAAGVATRTLTNNVIYGADMALGDASTGNLIFNGFSDFGGATRILTIGSGVTTTLGGGYGNGSVTKAGAGSLVFGSSGTLANLSINTGTASISAGQTLTLTTSQLAVGAAANFTISGTLYSKSTASWAAPTSGGTVNVGAGATIIQQGNGSPTNFIFGTGVTFDPTSTFVLRDYTNAISVSGRTYGMNLTFDTSGTGMNTGAISGAGTWTVNGNLTIGSNTRFSYGSYTGTTNFNGNVTVQSGGSLGLSAGATGARSFTINNGKVLTVDGSVILNSSETATIAVGGTIQGTGAVSGGTLSVDGVASPGDAGAVGTLSADTVLLNSTALLQMTISGTDKGINYDVLNAGSLTAGGTIKITLNGYAPVLGDVFDIVDYLFLTDNGVTFDFSSAVLAPGLGWDTTNFTGGNQDGTISVIAIPEPSNVMMVIGGFGLLAWRVAKRRQSAVAAR